MLGILNRCNDHFNSKNSKQDTLNFMYKTGTPLHLSDLEVNFNKAINQKLKFQISK